MFPAVRKSILIPLLILAILLSGISTSAASITRPSLYVQILAVNDFHGNLQPPSGSSGRVGSVNAGGAEYLSTWVSNLRATNPNTIFVSDGDMIGASPLLSALFHDEPTIEAFNLMGASFSSVGNHEFDEGVAELRRMANGGCHPVDGCLDGDDFAGASFKYLAANVIIDKNGKTLFPPFKVATYGGKKVAFVGLSLESTPTIVTPSGVAGLTFLNEAATVNAMVPMLQARGIKTIIVLIHEGGNQGVTIDPTTINTCDNVSGRIVDVVNLLDPEIDVVINGHTHSAYNCVINNKLVTAAYSFGRVVTDIDLTIDRTTGQVTAMSAWNNVVTRDVPADPNITALIEKYNAIAAPLQNRVIGTITADITRTANAAGESALGDVIADAQLYVTQPAGYGEAVVAFMNPGGIRADLIYAQISGSELPGEVTYGEMFTVQPFGNSLVTMSLLGSDIQLVLEQQFDNPTPGSMRILQVSNGLTYTWSASAPWGSKVSNVALNGVPLDPNAVYRVTVNSFLADGGDNFLALKNGTNRLGGAVDTDAFEAYFVAFSPVMPGPQNRITTVP